MDKRYALFKKKCMLCGRKILNEHYYKHELYFEHIDGYMCVPVCQDCEKEVINKIIKGEDNGN